MKLNPIHNFLGLKLRCNCREPHHMYWGIIALVSGLIGIVSALALGGLLGVILLVLELLNAMIGLWWILDDLYQHHKQIKDVHYHSPVHKMYVKAIYGDDSLINRIITKINKWMDG